MSASTMYASAAAARPHGRDAWSTAPYACAAVHALALALMALVLAPGTEVVADVGARAAYVASHAAVWRAAWLLWMASALTLLAFYFWWGRRVASLRFALLVVAVAATGAAFDLRGESIYAFVLPRLAAAAHSDGRALVDLAREQAVGTRLTAIWANAFYTAAGVMLTLRSPHLRRWPAAAAWTAWVAGAALSTAGVYDAGQAMAIASAVLFPALIALSAMLPRGLGGADPATDGG